MRQRDRERDRERKRETKRHTERVVCRVDFMIKLFEKYQGRRSSERK